MNTQLEALTQDIAMYPVGTLIEVGSMLYRRTPDTSLEWLEIQPDSDTDWRGHEELARIILMSRGRYDVLLPAGRIVDYIEENANWHDAEAGLDQLRTLVDEMRSGR